LVNRSFARLGKIDYWKDGQMCYDYFSAKRLEDHHNLKFEDFPVRFGSWKIGKCSSCKTTGIYFEGGKRSNHFCFKCDLNPKKLEPLGMDSSYG